MPDSSKEHTFALYGKGCILTGDPATDSAAVTDNLAKMAVFAKNQSNVIFQLQATGRQKTLRSGGVEAEEAHLGRYTRDVVHMVSGKTNRWTVHPDNQRIKCIWVLGDVWDFQDYDPFVSTTS